MKRFIITLFICVFLFCQGCMIDNIWYGNYSIEDRDDILKLSGCTEVTGTLSIEGSALTDLTGLESLTEIGGNFLIRHNPVLSNLDALSNITSVGEDLTVVYNVSLTNFSAFHNLSSIGEDLTIIGNSSATLIGFENITSLGWDLRIEDSDSLTSLAALSNITSVGGSLRIGVIVKCCVWR